MSNEGLDYHGINYSGKEEKSEEERYYPGIHYQKLFDYMSEQHNLTLLESEMNDIVHIVREMDKRDTVSKEEGNLKRLLYETAVRCNITLPTDEDGLKWFEEKTDAKTKSGRDFLLRLNDALKEYYELPENNRP